MRATVSISLDEFPHVLPRFADEKARPNLKHLPPRAGSAGGLPYELINLMPLKWQLANKQNAFAP
jgi:hypothetical protein